MEYTYRSICYYRFSFFYYFKVREEITVDYDAETAEGMEKLYEDLSKKVHALPKSLEILIAFGWIRYTWG